MIERLSKSISSSYKRKKERKKRKKNYCVTTQLLHALLIKRGSMREMHVRIRVPYVYMQARTHTDGIQICARAQTARHI